MFRSIPFAIVVLAVLVPLARAADTYKKGDEIEVFFLNKWMPAKVVATNAKGEVLAEYEFAARTQQRAFKPNEVRAAYESGALARGRTWSDASGTFKVKAALIELTAEAVTLRKEDKTEIKVAIDKLSGPDRAYLRKLEKELGPIAPKAQQAETFEQTAEFNALPWDQPNRAALTPDPIPPDLKVKQGGVVLPMANVFDKLGGVLPLGGAESLLLAVIENGTPNDPKPTRLVWTSLASQKIVGEQTLPGGEIVMDYHLPSGRLLTYSKLTSEENRWGEPTLTIWEVQPSDKQPKAVVRWKAQPPADQKLSKARDASARFPTSPWARLLEANLVLQHRGKQEYVVWDVEAKKLRYSLKQESFFAAPAALSGGQKYLVLPEDSRVRVLEVATGKLMCTLPADHGSSGVAVSPDGLRLAVLNRSTLTIWDLTSADAAPEVHQAEAVGTPFGANLAWASPERVAVSGRELVLFSLSHRIALWSYEFDWNAVREEQGRRLREIVDGHLVYAASVDRIGAQKSLAVGAVSLPGPRVDEVAASVTRESLLIVKPGTPVRLEISAGEHQSQVEAALTKQIQNNGWVLRSDATNVLSAEMKQGETQSGDYISQRTGERQSVTITPYVATLVLKVGDKVAWQSGSRSGIPSVMFLAPGQTAQGEADKWNKPNPRFFETVNIPDSILDPAKRNGLGVTQVTNRGLVPK